MDPNSSHFRALTALRAAEPRERLNGLIRMDPNSSHFRAVTALRAAEPRENPVKISGHSKTIGSQSHKLTGLRYLSPVFRFFHTFRAPTARPAEEPGKVVGAIMRFWRPWGWKATYPRNL